MIWQLDEVVRATGAEVHRRGAATELAGVTTDSRALDRGVLFVALRGARFDAHDFVAEAAAAGAAAVLVARVPAALDAHPDVAVLVVRDTLRALQDLAADLRRRLAPCVCAITGSNGKTTTKEMLASILAAAFGAHAVLKTQVNLNNLIGVPLTLLRLTGAERHAVVEMGMNAPGEIWRLTEIADPDVGVITNVAPAHLAGVGSIDGVARAKGELFARMRRAAVAVANADDHRVAALANDFAGRVVHFAIAEGAGAAGTANDRPHGIVARADVIAAEVRTDATGAARFRLGIGEASADVQLRIAGRHTVVNALAAAAAAHAVGVGLDAIAAGLGAVAPIGNRMRLQSLANGATIVNDSYNANPASVAAALRSLKDSPATRRIAVLGDMLELGADSAEHHRAVGRLAAELGIDALYAYGEYAAEMVAGARDVAGTRLGAEAVHVMPTHAAIADALGDIAAAGDWILVKGSRGQRMEEVVRLLGAAE